MKVKLLFMNLVSTNNINEITAIISTSTGPSSIVVVFSPNSYPILESSLAGVNQNRGTP
jgi:hypothetical protein